MCFKLTLQRASICARRENPTAIVQEQRTKAKNNDGEALVWWLSQKKSQNGLRNVRSKSAPESTAHSQLFASDSIRFANFLAHSQASHVDGMYLFNGDKIFEPDEGAGL